jgi:hypothetical protein
MTDLTAQTPVEIDTQLAEILKARYAAEDRQARVLSTLHSLVGDRKVYSWARGQRQGTWQLSTTEVINKAYEQRYTDSRIGREVTSFEETVAKLVSLGQEARPLNAEFDRRGGWTRAYLVDNDNGHVHSSMNCSSCYVTTRFSWVTALSGHDEAEIVDEAGERACTVCYPSAPVDVLHRASRIEGPNQRSAREEREARQVAKVNRDAEKAAKAISNPDGSPLKGKFDTLATERSAWIEIVENIVNHREYGYDANTEVNNRILCALHHKLGTSIDELRAQIEIKVAAKIKREGRR